MTYLYLPDADFKKLNSIDPKIQCNFDINFCKYLDSCENTNKLNFLLNLNIKGDTFNKDFQLNIEDLFVSGKTMGLNDNFCYMKVFRSFQGDQNTWYVGNAFMEKYYVAFDMSPNHKHQHDYLQVIIAEKNEAWTPNDYVPPADDEDDDDPPFIPADDDSDKEQDKGETPGIDTSNMGEGEHDIPKPKDDSAYDRMEQNMYFIIIGCSLTVFVLISILTCCCCKKRSYRYKSLNLGADGRTFT